MMFISLQDENISYTIKIQVIFFKHYLRLLPTENMGNASKWKESLVERTVSRKTTNLEQLVYGKSETKPDDSIQEDSDADESDDDEFFKPKGEGNKVWPTCVLFIYKLSIITCFLTTCFDLIT